MTRIIEVVLLMLFFVFLYILLCAALAVFGAAYRCVFKHQTFDKTFKKIFFTLLLELLDITNYFWM